MTDINGVLSAANADQLSEEQKLFVRADEFAGMSLADVSKHAKPSILLGLTASAGLFTKEVVQNMLMHTDRPIIFPLSNPTDVAECTAQQAYEWTDGRAIFASGSPFDSVVYKGTTFIPSQCNNMFIFPGVGLGAAAAGIRRVTDAQIYDCSVALAESMTPDEIADGRVFPDITRIRDVSHTVAMALIKRAYAEGLTTQERFGYTNPEDDQELADWLFWKMYDPVYVPLVDDVYRR